MLGGGGDAGLGGEHALDELLRLEKLEAHAEAGAASQARLQPVGELARGDDDGQRGERRVAMAEVCLRAGQLRDQAIQESLQIQMGMDGNGHRAVCVRRGQREGAAGARLGKSCLERLAAGVEF